MRNLFLVSLALVLAACSSSDGSIAGGGPTTTNECSVTGQKQFVLDAMNAWYLWNDQLPTNVNIDDFATPDDLLVFLSEFSPDDGNGNPVDKFSFINSAASDQAFFGEGQFEGFGFSFRFESADDARLTRVFGGSPAAGGGLARGQQIIALDGRTVAEIEAAEGLSAALDPMTVEFTMREPGGNEFTTTITKAIVTIDPIPQHRIIDNNGTPVGYMELATFISTADPAFDTVFNEFLNAGVQDVIIDLRYNGGGLVSTAELLGDYLGGSIAQNFTFSETRFNADRAAANNSTEPFELRTNSLSLARLVIIATQNTASASELVTNGLEPTSAEVVIVGDRTFGKPVGQIGLEFCDQILRPTAFQTVNGDGFGDFFNGLPVDCAAPDDLAFAVGDLADPNVDAALTWLSTGGCPVSSTPSVFEKLSVDAGQRKAETPASSWRQYAGAY